VIEVVPWLAVAVAVGLLAVGAAMLAGRHVGLMSASRVTVTLGTSGPRVLEVAHALDLAAVGLVVDVGQRNMSAAVS